MKQTQTIGKLMNTKKVKDLNKKTKVKLTFGQILSDKIATGAGSWSFIISFLSLLVLWIIINSWVLINKPFDPYPFILLNLILSCIAALQAPIIMMSQNRQEAKDRARTENDLRVDQKAEVIIEELYKKVISLEELILKIDKKLD